MSKKNILVVVLVISITLLLSGCSAMNTAIKKRNLEVTTNMSETIFLEPSSERTVYLQIKNTSDKDMSALQRKISHALRSKGYEIVHLPSKAHYWIQANVLKADKMEFREEAREAKEVGHGGFDSGSSLTGMALGAGIAGYNNNSIGSVLAAGLAAGLAGTVASSLVEDINYTMVTDVQIAERIKNNYHYKIYQTRIISLANKINLKFAEAQPLLEDQLATSIVGIL